MKKITNHPAIGKICKYTNAKTGTILQGYFTLDGWINGDTKLGFLYCEKFGGPYGISIPVDELVVIKN